ncbi:hypothetical protein CIT31_15745 [Mesorhizobium wenxiniae]|uniref:Uncharacterized protein n=2 Tax=Mesorhizobium wenxiniae TaxID=2014805 RepID=A0A271KIL8_9HYPH|nr:hypothetical protein CIT31_15745 [Mesorhizobium wenxiniae]
MTTDAPNRRSPARARGDIDAGREGDKTPGVDPAAAPMETDAEAAGNVPVESAHPVRGRAKFANAATYANAMRPLEGEAAIQPGSYGPVLVIVIVVIVAAAVFISAAMLRLS